MTIKDTSLADAYAAFEAEDYAQPRTLLDAWAADGSGRSWSGLAPAT